MTPPPLQRLLEVAQSEVNVDHLPLLITGAVEVCHTTPTNKAGRLFVWASTNLKAFG